MATRTDRVSAMSHSNLALGACFGDYRSGFSIRQVRVPPDGEPQNFSRFKPKVYLGFALSNSWVSHYPASDAQFAMRTRAAREAGDVVFMGYALGLSADEPSRERYATRRDGANS